MQKKLFPLPPNIHGADFNEGRRKRLRPLSTKVPHRSRYNAFIRSLTGVLARRIGKGIWQLSLFTRIAGWGKELRALEKYLEMNRFEAEGIMPRQPRTDLYAKWRPKRS